MIDLNPGPVTALVRMSSFVLPSCWQSETRWRGVSLEAAGQGGAQSGLMGLRWFHRR